MWPPSVIGTDEHCRVTERFLHVVVSNDDLISSDGTTVGTGEVYRHRRQL